MSYSKLENSTSVTTQTSNSKKFEFDGLYFLKNSNSIKLKIFEPKLGKLVSKLKLKLQKLIFIKLDMCLN